MSEQQGRSDPVQAFEDLRAEVSVLRKAIEVLPDALERNRAPDYSPDFAVLGQGMDAIGAALANLQKHPALRLTPEQHGSAVAQAGSVLVREAVQRFDHATQEAERERYPLSRLGPPCGMRSRRPKFFGSRVDAKFRQLTANPVVSWVPAR